MSRAASRMKYPHLEIWIVDRDLQIELRLPKKLALVSVLMPILKYFPEWWSILQTVLPFAGK